ncbi:MAG: hypothetical protein ACHQFW_10710 [Chitinophagales bacterium]
MTRIIILTLFTGFISMNLRAQSSEVDKLIPIDELGAEKFMNHEGGLYPNGSNEMPPAFYNDAVEMANSIQPLNKAGEPDPSGKIGLIGLGASTVAMFGKGLQEMVPETPGIDPAVRYINCGIGGQDLSKIMDPAANFWAQVDQRITSAGMSLNQVQVLWIEEDNLRNKSADIDQRGKDLLDDFIYIARFSKEHYPNLKLFYVCGRHTTAFMPAEAKDKHREPRAYINGWVCKWLIEKQIDGDKQLNYKGENAVAPLILWGPYFWTQGEKPRKDGYTWTPDLLVGDGIHPSQEGIKKVSKDLIDFWRTDPVSQLWFMETPGEVIQLGEPEYMNIMVNNSVINKISYGDISDDFRITILKDSTVVYNRESEHITGDYKIELNEAGNYKYVISDEQSRAFAADFVVNSDLSVASIEQNISKNDTSAENYIDPNAPAWIVNGTNKMAKLKRVLAGHSVVKVVVTDSNGKVLFEETDVLNKHTDLNEQLDRGEYNLKFYDEDGSEILLPEEFRSAVRIKY